MDKPAREEILRKLFTSRISWAGGVRTIWFDEPFYLYLEDAQAENYLEMISIEKFAQQLHEPARELLHLKRKELLKGLKSPVDFYDLGPGLPTKTIPLLLELKDQRRPFTYRPVDINHRFLRLTEKEIGKIGVKAESLNCLFEDLPQIIQHVGSPANSRLFMIGLTFNNYRPGRILRLLKALSGSSDVSIITTEFYSSQRKARILSPYEEKITERFNRYLLTVIGLPARHLTYFTIYRNQRIEMGFEIRNSFNLRGYRFDAGTRIVTAISYRYTRNSLIHYLEKYFGRYELFEDRAHQVSVAAIRLQGS